MELEENLFESWAEARPNEAKVYDLIDNGVLDWETVGGAALSWISDDDVGELARQCSWFIDESLKENKSISSKMLEAIDNLLVEDSDTRVNANGVKRPTSYINHRKKNKPLSVDIYDGLTNLGYDVFAGTNGYAYRISKRLEKNLQPAKDYLDKNNVQYKIQPFQKRFHLLISLPDDTEEASKYFDAGTTHKRAI